MVSVRIQEARKMNSHTEQQREEFKKLMALDMDELNKALKITTEARA